MSEATKAALLPHTSKNPVSCLQSVNPPPFLLDNHPSVTAHVQEVTQGTHVDSTSSTLPDTLPPSTLATHNYAVVTLTLNHVQCISEATKAALQHASTTTEAALKVPPPPSPPVPSLPTSTPQCLQSHSPVCRSMNEATKAALPHTSSNHQKLCVPPPCPPPPSALDNTLTHVQVHE
jgi:hypothetical protein